MQANKLHQGLRGYIFCILLYSKYEYVITTINVKEQKLKVFLYENRFEEFQYKLRPLHGNLTLNIL